MSGLYRIPPETTDKSGILKLMILNGEKNFADILAPGIYLANRNSMIYERVSRLIVTNARFSNCDFENACFDTISFRGAEFRGVSFRDAIFCKTEFHDCLFVGCDFSDAHGFNTVFTDCRGDLSFLRHMEPHGPEAETDDPEASELDDDEDKMEY
jgi:uncharacterized protein YjbI with pentapeptide repeats